MKAGIFILWTVLLLAPRPGRGQTPFSVATDVSLLRNFDGEQSFTVPGQSLSLQWHPDKKYVVYSYFTYHWNGKYAHSLLAEAKQPATQPSRFSFLNRSEMSLRHISIGIKKYLAGSFQNEERLAVYLSGGFGLMMGRASNNFSVAVDTSLYDVQEQIVSGSGRFKRLSFDVAAGAEYPVGYVVFLYGEARVMIPTTAYPSRYLLKNNHAPLPGSIQLGIRILFNDDRD